MPATRTKAKRKHGVPLCRRAEQILDAARTLGAGNPLVFPSGSGKPLTDMAVSGLLKDLEIGGVPPGFRSSFRDLAPPRRRTTRARWSRRRWPRWSGTRSRPPDLFERRRRMYVRTSVCQG